MFGGVNRAGSPLNNPMFGMPGNASSSMQQIAPFNSAMAGGMVPPGNVAQQSQLQGLERHFNEPPGVNMNMMGPGFHGAQTSPVQNDAQWQGGSMMNMQPKGYKTVCLKAPVLVTSYPFCTTSSVTVYLSILNVSQVICKFWENNMCTKGASCTFAHGAEDLKRLAGSGPAYRRIFPSPLVMRSDDHSLTGVFPAPIASPGLLSPVKMDRYKTKLCLFHLQSRCCKGPHCPYAHGVEELRAPMPPAVLSAFQRFGSGNGAIMGVDFTRLNL